MLHLTCGEIESCELAHKFIYMSCMSQEQIASALSAKSMGPQSPKMYIEWFWNGFPVV